MFWTSKARSAACSRDTSGWRGVRVERVSRGTLDDLREAVSREPVEFCWEELVCSDFACEVGSMMAYSGGKVW